MKLKNAITTALLLTTGFILPAHADTAKARCEIHQNNQKKAVKTFACSFSQRQGYIDIDDQKNGVSYSLSPVGDKPGNYTDQDGKTVYRKAGLGSKGQIFQWKNQSLYVYW